MLRTHKLESDRLCIGIECEARHGGTPPSEEFILLVLCWCCMARQTAPLGNTVIAVCEYQAILEQGALLVIDEGRARIRILPLQRRV